MDRRYAEAEKGKGVLDENSLETTIKRIKAPTIDTTKLIQENELTLIGRLTNPQEQRIWSLIPSLPRKWNPQGRLVGSDLGHNCFQFRFEREDDLQKVLANRPYHFGYWMVILQRWEPVISDFFPSKISFWIRVKGLPLHYWDEKVLCGLGRELGTLEKHELTKTSARVRVLIDGLKPLTKETILEFDSGEESMITLEYECLENHCSICLRLTHKSSQCPSKLARERQAEDLRNYTEKDKPSLDNDLTNQKLRLTNYSRIGETQRKQDETYRSFHQRVDRHGRSFGDRVSTKQTRNPPPVESNTVAAQPEKKRTFLDATGASRYSSPPYTQNRDSYNRGP